MSALTYAAEAGGTGSAAAVSDNLASVRQDISNLAESVKRLASVEGAQESLNVAIRRNPIQSVFVAAAIGFVVALIVAR